MKQIYKLKVEIGIEVPRGTKIEYRFILTLQPYLTELEIDDLEEATGGKYISSDVIEMMYISQLI